MAKSSSNEYKDWEARLSVAHKVHEKRVKEPTERNRKYYKGDQWHDAEANKLYKDHPIDNIIFSNIQTIKPSINFSNPKIFVKPRNPVRRTENGVINTFQAAKLVQMLANYDYRELRLKRQMDKVLIDSLMGPFGCMYMGYTLKTEKFKGGDENEKQIEIHELIKEDSPFAVRLSPMDLRIDPMGQDHLLEDHRWIGVRWLKPLEDVKDDPRYSNLRGLKPNHKVDIKKVMGMGPDGDIVLDHNDLNKMSPEGLWEMVEGWDLWDKKTHRLRTVVEGHGRFLRDDKEWPLDMEGFPVEMLYFNENPDDAIPVDDIGIYIDSQDELNRIKALKLEHLRRVSRRRFAARQEALDEEAKDQLMYGPDGVVIEVDGDPNTSFLPLRDAAISQDFHIVEQSLKQGIREESGINQFEKGIGRGVDSATESQLIAQGTAVRRADREMQFKDFALRVSKKLLHIRQQTLDSSITIPLENDDFKMAKENELSQLEKITAPNGASVLLPWLKLQKNDIQGDYEFDLDISSLRMRNEDQEKREALMLYQGSAQDPFINPGPPRKNILEKFNVPNIDEWLRDPQEVLQQQAQAAQAQQQVEIQSEQLKRATDLEKTRMKTEQSDVESKREFAIKSGNIIQEALRQPDAKKEGE